MSSQQSWPENLLKALTNPPEHGRAYVVCGGYRVVSVEVHARELPTPPHDGEWGPRDGIDPNASTFVWIDRCTARLHLDVDPSLELWRLGWWAPLSDHAEDRTPVRQWIATTEPVKLGETRSLRNY